MCGNDDTPDDNDILLCDAVDCGLAFHQKCLRPALGTEDIPEGDDDWCCPHCNCRFDCIDIINEDFGTEYAYSIQKVCCMLCRNAVSC